MSHAVLSPSSAERWLSCTASVDFTKDMPDESSPYAEEGTQAHTAAELRAGARLGLRSPEETLALLEEWADEVPEDSQEEMLIHADGWADLLAEHATEDTQTLLERRVDTGVPSCWGTADAILLRPGIVQVADYKYGRGVRVEAEENPQLKLYGLGALHDYGDLLYDIDTVRLTVHQPRLDHTSTWEISAAELLRWRDEIVIPAAKAALEGTGSFGPSESACRWCPAAGSCKARFDKMTRMDFGDPREMSDFDYAEALSRVPEIRDWLVALESAALSRVYSEGKSVPGWKVVRSNGRRSIADQTAAIQTLIDAGFGAEQVADFKARPIGELEKLVGKPELTSLLGGLLVKSEGKPSLVPSSDKRPTISPGADAAAEFALE